MISLICILLVSTLLHLLLHPSLIINVPDELLWSTNGDDIYVQCIELDEYIVTFPIDKPLVDSP
jgi:hypothetical protein